jgi:PBSX family phage terminase large subunit
MAFEAGTKRIRLFKEQSEAFKSDKQFIIVVCGSQSGKTFLGSCWAYRNLTRFPDKNGLISAPTYKVLQQSTMDKFFSMHPWMRQFYKEQKQEIVLPDISPTIPGGKIFVRSADQPLGIEGMTIHWGWLDEYGQASHLAWTVCKTRTSTTGGQLMVTTTPYALNWLYEECYKPWKEAKDPRIDFFSWNSITNKYFKKEHYEAEKMALSKEEFGRRYEGRFTRMAGLVYQDFTDDLITDWKKIEPVEVFSGVDFGFTNPAAVLIIQKDKDGHYWVTDEWYEPGKDQNEINETCQFYRDKYKFNKFYPDVAEPDRILAMKRARITCMESNKDVAHGIDRVRQLFRQKRLHIFKNCRNLLDELQTYHYPEDIEKGMKEEPVKEKDHACDALRYAIATHPIEGLKGEMIEGGIKKQESESLNAPDIKKLLQNQGSDEDSWKYS